MRIRPKELSARIAGLRLREALYIAVRCFTIGFLLGDGGKGKKAYKAEAEKNESQPDLNEDESSNSDDVFDADFEDLTDEKK